MKYSTVLIFLLSSSSLLFAQEKCEVLNRKVHQDEVGASKNNECCIDSSRVADSILLNTINTKEIIEFNAPFGLPQSNNKNEVLIVNPNYLIGYDTIMKITSWVQYKLTPAQTKVGRTDCFRYDPRLRNEVQASYNDYGNNVNLQRGHMRPSDDGQGSLMDNLNTFIMTNMTPQYGELNQCEWLVLESFINKHSSRENVEEAYIISGSITSDTSKILNELVTIPDAFYKIYFFKQLGEWHYWTYYINHDRELETIDLYKKYLFDHQKTIREIELLANVNFHVTDDFQDNSIELETDPTFSVNELGKYAGWCSQYLKKE